MPMSLRAFVGQQQGGQKAQEIAANRQSGDV